MVHFGLRRPPELQVAADRVAGELPKLLGAGDDLFAEGGDKS
jgi:hypothetical protein